ncbi:MAG: VOC family protein [Pseudobdellovibrionaceae bacterium]
MIDHIDIPVSDLKLSRAFYERAFLPLGFKVSFGEEGRFWAFNLAGNGLFEIYQAKGPFTKIHVAFRAKTRGCVHEFYKAAMEAGAKDNGGPGPRLHYTPNYYACFVFDPDGHNIETVHDNWETE